MDTPQLGIPKIARHFLSIDILYVFMAGTLLILIYLGQNIMDVLYFCLITYYYIKLKWHRRKVGK